MLNCVTHAIGALLGIVGFIMSMKLLMPTGNIAAIVSTAVFCTALIVLYTNSAVYHGWGLTKAKKYFQIIDHCSVFLLIAGTYTPFTLMVMGNTAGKAIFAIVAIASIIGIVLNIIDLKKYSKISMVCYLATGWCIIFAFGSISAALSTNQLIMLVGGGIAYTLGAILYGVGVKVRYMHTVWHLFVLAGSMLHYACIYSFILTNF
jgi:hemolysin III